MRTIWKVLLAMIGVLLVLAVVVVPVLGMWLGRRGFAGYWGMPMMGGIPGFHMFGGVFPFYGMFGGLMMLLFTLIPIGLFVLLVIGLVALLRRPAIPAGGPPVPPAPPATTRTCSNCGRPAQADWNTCPYCGQKL